MHHGSRLPLDAHTAAQLLAPQGGTELRRWVAGAATRLDRMGAVLFPLGRLHLGLETSRALAIAIASRVCAVLLERGAPPELRVEVDRPQRAEVVPGYRARTLLPHHDGGHCSYLTPSLLDAPGFDPELRAFSTSGFTTTPAHKLHQGIFVLEPGDGLSVTSFYPLLSLLASGFRWSSSRAPTGVAELAGWLGANVRRAGELRARHKSRYVSLAAMLGATALVDHAVAPHHAEDSFSARLVKEFPELRSAASGCSCGSCTAPAERFFCRSLQRTTGLSWSVARRRFERCLTSERHDYLLANNLVLLHGGIGGGRSRLLQPISFVIDRPEGAPYERWLAEAWRRAPRWNSASGVARVAG
jgi:hypothetical protein